MNATLLIELRTEELPPKVLSRLGEVFAQGVSSGLAERALMAPEGEVRWYASPRRLALQIPHVLAVAPEATVHEKIMPVSVALDASGQPTPALLKKLEAKGIPLDAMTRFERRMDGKSDTFFYQARKAGAELEQVLSGVVSDALKKLPIPKVMRWGDLDVQFVRPVHGLIMMHGERILKGDVLGLTSGNVTRGHRFLSAGELRVAHADSYAETLEKQGKVIACFAQRRELIREQLEAKARELNAVINPAPGLLDEVTALVEWPVVYVGEFEAEFLEVPQECLILTMQQNQKYFPLLAADGANQGKLLNKFLIVSNMEVANPHHIISGNARVVRPRLSDARFFFNQDRKQALASRIDRLGQVVHHNKLGSVLDRVLRLERLSGQIAGLLGADAALGARAGRLAKADLTTDMVGEFPELQGIMGRYYAHHDGESAVVADAIEAHYRPRFAGDALPQGPIACAASLADKLDALVGFFGIGQLPSGDKDPFGLRRAALGVLRILMETPMVLPLDDLIRHAAQAYHAGVLTAQGFEGQLLDFMHDRLRGLLRDTGSEAGYSPDAIEAVLVQRPTRIDLIPAKLVAVRHFLELPEAQALAAANKRIGNLLKKVEADHLTTVSESLLTEPAERTLYAALQALAPEVHRQVNEGKYTEALLALAGVRKAVDDFFDQVMVMAEEATVRTNRLTVLKQLSDLFNAVADISRLAV